jgi:Zn-dependent protease with chaperone function
MDFFKAQDESKQRSLRLLWWFAPAIAFLFFGAHLIAVMVFRAIPYDLTGDLHSLFTDEGIRHHSLTYLFWHPRVMLASQIPVAILLLSTIGTKWRELSQGGGLLLMAQLKARRLSRLANDAERRLRNISEEMAIAAGIKVPPIFVLDDEKAINAMCAGFSSDEAVIAVTQGALDKLNRDELQGVIAHEFGHILNGDLPLNMRLSCLMNGFTQISLLGLYLSFLTLPAFWLGSIFVFVALVGGLSGMLILIVGGIGLIVGRAVQRATTREREFLADAKAVQLARLSDGLAGALQKAGGGKALGNHVSHMLFQDREPGWLATHPPIAERIRRLGAVDIKQETVTRLQAARPQRAFQFNDADDAMAGIYAVLLLDHGGEVEPLLNMLAGLVSPDIVARTQSHLQQMTRLDLPSAGETIRLALAHLSGLDEKSREALIRNAERLALGDGHQSAGEESLLQILRGDGPVPTAETVYDGLWT